MTKTLTTVTLAFALAGCAASRDVPRITIANTPEGHACANACMQTYHACVGSAEGVGKLAVIGSCKDELEQCGLACPGGHYAEQQPASR